MKIFFMTFILFILLTGFAENVPEKEMKQERVEVRIVNELFRLRNEHKTDSAELLYADTVLVYMKYLRNIPRKVITKSDKGFWKAHPKNKFEIIKPVQVTDVKGIPTAIIIGKEYLDGKDFIYERIEIKFDRNKKINYFRGYKIKNPD
jgi:hypothetical protein